MTATILTIDGVEAVYNNAILALRDVSLAVRPGEIVGLLGANGAGKSTTLKAVSNLLPAERGRVTKGRILYNNISITTLPPADLVRSGLVQVLEGRHCFRALTVEENLVVGSFGSSARRQNIKRDLQRIYALFPRLADKRHTKAGLTSGGEQQMTAIGRALMAHPTLLILDEPSMGLAPLIVQDIFRTLKALNRSEGLSILVAEQNSTIALHYADRAYVLENGRVALNGTAAELRRRKDIQALYLGAPGAPGASVASSEQASASPS